MFSSAFKSSLTFVFAKLTLSLFLIFQPNLSEACSTFMARDSRGNNNWMGKNYDWHLGHGSVYVNQRDLEKINTHPYSTKNFSWKAKFGSLTFSQFGKEFPISGVNEKNLVVETLWLNGSSFPDAGSHSLPLVNELQWVQYILDNSSSVDEAIFNANQIHVSPLYAQVHYLVCDINECASFEYLNKSLVINKSGTGKNFSVLTNSSYQESSANLGSYIDFGGQQAIPSGYDSLVRFARLASQIQTDPVVNTSGEIVGRLKSVQSPSSTQWTLVYNLADRSVEFSSRQSLNTKKISYGNLDFSCKPDSLVFDMSLNLSGSIDGRLQKMTYDYNKAMIYKNTFVQRPILDQLVEYPGKYTACK